MIELEKNYKAGKGKSYSKTKFLATTIMLNEHHIISIDYDVETKSSCVKMITGDEYHVNETPHQIRKEIQLNTI